MDGWSPGGGELALITLRAAVPTHSVVRENLSGSVDLQQ